MIREFKEPTVEKHGLWDPYKALDNALLYILRNEVFGYYTAALGRKNAPKAKRIDATNGRAQLLSLKKRLVWDISHVYSFRDVYGEDAIKVVRFEDLLKNGERHTAFELLSSFCAETSGEYLHSAAMLWTWTAIEHVFANKPEESKAAWTKAINFWVRLEHTDKFWEELSQDLKYKDYDNGCEIGPDIVKEALDCLIEMVEYKDWIYFYLAEHETSKGFVQDPVNSIMKQAGISITPTGGRFALLEKGLLKEVENILLPKAETNIIVADQLILLSPCGPALMMMRSGDTKRAQCYLENLPLTERQYKPYKSLCAIIRSQDVRTFNELMDLRKDIGFASCKGKIAARENSKEILRREYQEQIIKGDITAGVEKLRKFREQFGIVEIPKKYIDETVSKIENERNVAGKNIQHLVKQRDDLFRKINVKITIINNMQASFDNPGLSQLYELTELLKDFKRVSENLLNYNYEGVLKKAEDVYGEMVHWSANLEELLNVIKHELDSIKQWRQDIKEGLDWAGKQLNMISKGPSIRTIDSSLMTPSVVRAIRQSETVPSFARKPARSFWNSAVGVFIANNIGWLIWVGIILLIWIFGR